MIESTNAAWLDRVRAAWTERAPWWDELSEVNATTDDRQRDLARIADALALHDGARVLDAGCGTGQYAIALALRGCAVTGIDLAPAMIERARTHAGTAGVSIDWRVGDIVGATSDLPDKFFDAVHARVVLQFVPDLSATLLEFRRCLREGGRLLASVPGALSPIYNTSWRRFIDPEPPGTSFLLPWELIEVLREQGWSIVDEWGEYGRNLAGDVSGFDPEAMARLDIRLRRAAATTWTVIAES